ncbi:(E,E)-geranyllinalool synthase-like [Actinidia eriantha]|uniref:(E,E)-geranyllinalool synthase-like n=1 Tax=Actinidia eriantha TaxID=165200 RepID=UPI0025878D9D|nr:(E,E)-geranyllinalool synthase-like [Actinidia eriantha]
MKSSLSSFETLVKKIKQSEMFSNFDPYSFVSTSAYDTAWLAMIPNPKQKNHPLFGCCLDWILDNQKELGFWGGEYGSDGLPTIDSLPATLACMVVLKKWDIGDANIKKGLGFVHEHTERLLKEKLQSLPRWFTIVFPAMVELAQATGLDVVADGDMKEVLSDVFCKRQQILETEECTDEHHYPPLLSCLEALPYTCDINGELTAKYLREDGSLFQSPSATARAYMVTGERKCMEYLLSCVRKCPRGVPPIFPMDEELIKLSLVDQIQRLGLAEYFNEEIDEILSEVYRTCKKKRSYERTISNIKPAKIYKDSLAFRLLRMHGYSITPWSFCWFVQHEDMLAHIENNSEYFTSAMFNVYRATDLMFSGEYELNAARGFARKLLEKNLKMTSEEDGVVLIPNFKEMVEHELSLPWLARMDHLDHRVSIEAANKGDALWVAKASVYGLSCLTDDKLIKLAVENYKFRQSIYQNELEEVKRWSKDWGLADMGFGREKTTYCYFAVAASSSLPHDSPVRLIVAKSGILITVADDFFDEKGSLQELQTLTHAVQRWDGKDLSGYGKIIFDVLDDLVSDIANKHYHQQGSDITENLRDIWRETFASWLVESTWSNTGYVPSVHEYLDTGMTSVASHTMVLSASCFLNPKLPNHKLKRSEYEPITKLLMATARLLNDIQSYQREQIFGNTNLVLLHQKEYPEAEIEDSIAYVKDILDEKKRDLLEHALTDSLSDLPKPCKLLHLSCLKVFQMFFNASNRFDSNTDLLHDIKKAIYAPPEYHVPKHPLPSLPEKKYVKVQACLNTTFQGVRCTRKILGRNIFTSRPSKVGCEKAIVLLKFKACTM